MAVEVEFVDGPQGPTGVGGVPEGWYRGPVGHDPNGAWFELRSLDGAKRVKVCPADFSEFPASANGPRVEDVPVW